MMLQMYANVTEKKCQHFTMARSLMHLQTDLSVHAHLQENSPPFRKQCDSAHQARVNVQSSWKLTFFSELTCRNWKCSLWVPKASLIHGRLIWVAHCGYSIIWLHLCLSVMWRHHRSLWKNRCRHSSKITSLHPLPSGCVPSSCC